MNLNDSLEGLTNSAQVQQPEQQQQVQPEQKTYGVDLSGATVPIQNTMGPQGVLRVVDTGEEMGYFEAFTGGLKHSNWAGQAIRKGMNVGESEGFLAGMAAAGQHLIGDNFNQYQLSEEEQQLWMDSNIPAHMFPHVLRGVDSPERFKMNLKQFSESREFKAKLDEQDWDVQLASGIGESLTPEMLLSAPAGAATKGVGVATKMNKLLNNKYVREGAFDVALAVGVEAGFKEQTTGQDADLLQVAAGTLALGTAVRGAGDGWKHFRSKGQQARLDAAQAAVRDGNLDDVTVVKDHDGTSKIMDDGEGGQIEVTESGKVVTAGVIPPKSASDGRMGKLRDLSTVANNADSESIRGLAAQITRPTQGYKDGFAAETPTAEVVKVNLDNRNLDALSRMEQLTDDITNRSFVSGLTGNNKLARQELNKRIRQHLDGNQVNPPLNAKEMQLADQYRQFYAEQAGYMKDPGGLTGKQSPALLDGLVDNYVPHVVNNRVMNKLISENGHEAVQQAIADSWTASWRHADANMKARIEAAIKAEREGIEEITEEVVAKYARDKAYGLVAERKGAFDSQLITDSAEGLSNSGSPDFLKHRVPFGTMGEATLNGKPFRHDDILSNDLENITAGYGRNVSGMVSLVSATGKSIDELNDLIAKMPRVTQADQEAVTAMEGLMKTFTGQARRDYTGWDMLSDALRDITSVGTNALIWMNGMIDILQHTFTRPTMVAKTLGHLTVALGRDLKSVIGMKPKELEETFADVIAGRQMSVRMKLSYADWADGLAQRTGGRYEDKSTFWKIGSRMQYAAKVASDRSPFTVMMQRTQEAMVNMGNETGLAEMIAHAHGRGKTSLFDPKFLASEGIPQDVADRALAFLKENSPNGMTPRASKEARADWLADPRTTDVHRILNAFNDNLIMKADRAGQQWYTPMGPIGRLLMQYKRFVVMSSQYASKALNDAAQFGRADHLITLAGGIFFAGPLYHVANTGYKAMWMDDAERRKFLEERLAPTAIMVGSLQRTPLLSLPSMAYDFVGGAAGLPYAGMSKTTGGEKFEGHKGATAATTFGVQNSALNTLAGMTPAMRTGASIVSGVENTLKLSYDSLVDPDYLRNQKQERAKLELSKSIKQVLPNDPALQALWRNISREFADVDPNSKKR